MYLADFHVHTTWSDGKLPMRAVVDLYGSQGFGAIAITDEYVGGHYLKRIVAIDRLHGDAYWHRDRFVATARTLA